MLPTPGETVAGKYRVLGTLGAGGMGTVFEAVHTITQRRVALKWLHPWLTLQPGARARLIREAQACARVRHPHVVDIYDVVDTPQGVFLVLEYLDGETLARRLERAPMTLSDLLNALLPIMRALHAAHGKGIVHRDIKPDNILLADVSGSVVPKLLDFGISKLDASEGHTRLTLAGAAMGTPRYMAFEQLLADRSLDGRADIYAIGVILYEVLSGRAPFAGDSPAAVAMNMAQGPAPSLSGLRPDLPAEFCAIVERSVAIDRERRVQRIEHLIDALTPYRRSDVVTAKLASRSQQSTRTYAPAPQQAIGSVAAPRRRTPGMGYAVLLGAALALASAWGLARSSRGPAAPPAASVTRSAPKVSSAPPKTVSFAPPQALPVSVAPQVVAPLHTPRTLPKAPAVARRPTRNPARAVVTVSPAAEVPAPAVLPSPQPGDLLASPVIRPDRSVFAAIEPLVRGCLEAVPHPILHATLDGKGKLLEVRPVPGGGPDAQTCLQAAVEGAGFVATGERRELHHEYLSEP